MTRRAFLAAAPLSLAGGASLAYAAVLEPRFRLVEAGYALSPRGWAGGPGLRIVILADIHMGPPQMTPARLRGICDRAMALQPDLIVLLGDYIAEHPYVSRHVPAAETVAELARLEAPLGVHAILGNHDWWSDAEAQRRGGGPTLWHGLFERAGIPVLENGARRLSKDGSPFWVAGIGSQIAFRERKFRGADDLDRALAPLARDDAPAILLVHEPDIFPRVPDRVALTLAGHTHGGQVRIFGWAPQTASRYGQAYVYGHVEEAGRHLVTSGGLGCSRAPIRFGCPPEITVVDISAPR